MNMRGSRREYICRTKIGQIKFFLLAVVLGAPIFGVNLTITTTSDGIVRLSWPRSAGEGFYLQRIANLSSKTEWDNLSDPATEGGAWIVTDHTSGASQFYRLRAWEILFDGSSTDAFRGYQSESFPSRWLATSDGELQTLPYSPKSVGTNDIVTRQMYLDFELRWEWNPRIGGNSGVIYRTSERRSSAAQSGPEYQLLDDNYENFVNLPSNVKMGAVYALLSPIDHEAVESNDWNVCRLIVVGDHVEHWLNNQQVLQYEINGADWANALSAYPTYGSVPDFGQATPGYIAFQCHGEFSCFRNIRLRLLEKL
jgi:hypothetical protein